MRLPTLRIEDVPKVWRPVVSFLVFVGAAAGLALMFRAWIMAEARAEARIEVHRVREADVAAFKVAALEAARAGAQQAVREAVEPVLRDLRVHESWDHEAQRATERRLEVLEGPPRKGVGR